MSTIDDAFGLWSGGNESVPSGDVSAYRERLWHGGERATHGVKLPALPLTGGCQCGQVRYSISAAPYVSYLCHCSECQRHTSSAFGESLRVRQADLEISGILSAYRRVAESGAKREGRFCPDCGVRIVHGTAGAEMVNIKAGTLDDTSWLRPAGHIWTRSKQPFVSFAPDDLVYETQPTDGYVALAERWREMLSQS